MILFAGQASCIYFIFIFCWPILRCVFKIPDLSRKARAIPARSCQKLVIRADLISSAAPVEVASLAEDEDDGEATLA